MKVILRFKGGPGSGNEGHAGIPGHQGGSLPKSGGKLPRITRAQADALQHKHDTTEEGLTADEHRQMAEHWRGETHNWAAEAHVKYHDKAAELLDKGIKPTPKDFEEKPIATSYDKWKKLETKDYKKIVPVVGTKIPNYIQVYGNERNGSATFGFEDAPDPQAEAFVKKYIDHYKLPFKTITVSRSIHENESDAEIRWSEIRVNFGSND
jgi:hypothetical protein